jgi:hypothetical protein
MNKPTAVEEREQVMSVDHAQWLMHPMTKTLLYILNKHEQHLSDTIANASMDPNLSDQYVRQLAVQLKTTKTIKKTINETTTFVAKSH